jgi:hypothetical protein
MDGGGNLLPDLLYHVSECLEQGGIRHAPIIGVKLNELEDGCWGHKVLCREEKERGKENTGQKEKEGKRRKKKKAKSEEDFRRVFE